MMIMKSNTMAIGPWACPSIIQIFSPKILSLNTLASAVVEALLKSSSRPSCNVDTFAAYITRCLSLGMCVGLGGGRTEIRPLPGYLRATQCV